MTGSQLHSGYKSMTDALELKFPWDDHRVVVHSPSDLTPRQAKYLKWCLDQQSPQPTRNRRLLSVLGFLTYRQAVYWLNTHNRRKPWLSKTG